MRTDRCGVIRWAALVVTAFAFLAAAAPARGTDLVLNIEVDYLVGQDHTHALDSVQIARMVSMFACEGIELNVVLDDAVPEDSLPCSVEDFDCCLNYMGSFADHGGDALWRRAVLLHNSPSAHEAFANGFEFYLVGVPGTMPALFLHEMGHTCYLPLDNFSPNYPSMSYRFIQHGIASGMACDGLNTSCVPLKELDYSHGTMPTLNEQSLDEQAGIGYGPVDWNCDGVIESAPVAVNVERSSRCGGSVGQLGPVLQDHDDWGHIRGMLEQAQRGVVAKQGTPPTCGVGAILAASSQTYLPVFSYSPCYYGFADSFTQWADEPPCDSVAFPDEDGDGRERYCDPCPTQAANTCCCHVPGDVNHSGVVTYPADYSLLYDYCFNAGAEPPCLEEADVNTTGTIDAADVIRLYRYLRWSTGADYIPRCGVPGM
jgi:hypothetical protein